MGGGAGVSENFFYYESKFIFFFGRGGGARVSEFFSKNPNLNKRPMGHIAHLS